MQFKPGKAIVLQNARGAEVVARPFFYTPWAGSPIRVELYTSDGVRLKCLNEATGEYLLGDHGPPLRIKQSHKTNG